MIKGRKRRLVYWNEYVRLNECRSMGAIQAKFETGHPNNGNLLNNESFGNSPCYEAAMASFMDSKICPYN